MIYLEDVKMAMLGVGLIVPGFLAFFSNLLKSEPHVKLSGEWSLDYFKGGECYVGRGFAEAFSTTMRRSSFAARPTVHSRPYNPTTHTSTPCIPLVALHEIYLFPVSEQIVKMRFPPSFREFGAAVYEYNHSVLLGIMSTPDESDVDYGVSEGLDLGIDGSCNSSGKRHKRGVCLVNPTDHLINQPMVLFIMSKDKATALSAIFSAEAFILADRLASTSTSTHTRGFAADRLGPLRRARRSLRRKKGGVQGRGI